MSIQYIRCKVKDEAKDYTFVVVDLLINYTWFCHVNEGNTHGTKLVLEKLLDYNQQWRSPNDIEKMLETSREDELQHPANVLTEGCPDFEEYFRIA